MARYADNSIKKLREGSKLSINGLADIIRVDPTTIYRYESGKLKPSPDVMYEICRATGNLNQWCLWMRQEYPASYAKVHPPVSQKDTTGLVLSLYADILEAQRIQSRVFRECADGEFEDDGKTEFGKIVVDIARESQTLLNRMEERRNASDKAFSHKC